MLLDSAGRKVENEDPNCGLFIRSRQVRSSSALRFSPAMRGVHGVRVRAVGPTTSRGQPYTGPREAPRS